jgi:hypothetical protein
MWRAAGALERSDGNTIRWLVATALLDRCLTWMGHPILRGVHEFLATASLGKSWQQFERGVWTAYRLKDHRLLAPLDQFALTARKTAAEQFAEFSVVVDSNILEVWRQKFATRRPAGPCRMGPLCFAPRS